MDHPAPLAERPRYPDELADVAADLDAVFRRAASHRTLGITVRDWGPGWAVLSLTPSPGLWNLVGSLHGGATYAVADAAFEIAGGSHGRAVTALETTCHYHRPGPVDREVTATAWEVSRGHRTATYRMHVTDDDGLLVASYQALAYRTSQWHVDPSRLPEASP